MFQTRLRLLRSSVLSRVGAATLVSMALCIGLAPSAHARVLRDEEGHHQARYYLGLGASYAFGYQEARINAELATGTYNPASFNTGYVDDFAQALAADAFEVQLRGVLPEEQVPIELHAHEVEEVTYDGAEGGLLADTREIRLRRASCRAHEECIVHGKQPQDPARHAATQEPAQRLDEPDAGDPERLRHAA